MPEDGADRGFVGARFRDLPRSPAFTLTDAGTVLRCHEAAVPGVEQRPPGGR